MEHVTLSPELERFATEAVTSGRYRSLSELVATSVELLRQAESEVASFVGSLEAARAEANRDGWASLDELTVDLSLVIAESRDQET